MSELTKCKYMKAAYPTLDVEDCCEGKHRHEQRVFDLAAELARVFQPSEVTDEKIGWFLDDADAVVDDFPQHQTWEVIQQPEPTRRDVAHQLRINGIEYVVQESEWEPTHPVRRSTYNSWLDGAAEEDTNG